MARAVLSLSRDGILHYDTFGGFYCKLSSTVGLWVTGGRESVSDAPIFKEGGEYI